MVSGRADCTECIGCLAGLYLVDGKACRAAATEGGVDRSGRQECIGIQCCDSPAFLIRFLRGFQFDDAPLIIRLVGCLELFDGGAGCGQRFRARQSIDCAQYGGHAFGALHVSQAGGVSKAV